MLDGREVRIEPASGGVRIAPREPELAGPVRRYLGEPFDLDAFAAFAATDQVLAEIVPALHGFRPPLVPDPFETLVTSITAQQISLHAAFSIRNRLIEAFGDRHDIVYAFPTRERLAYARPDEIVAVGFSRRKAEYVVGLAQADLDLQALAFRPDDDVKTCARRAAGDRRVDRGLVLGPSPRSPARLARRRPRASQGRAPLLRRRHRRRSGRCAFFATLPTSRRTISSSVIGFTADGLRRACRGGAQRGGATPADRGRTGRRGRRRRDRDHPRGRRRLDPRRLHGDVEGAAGARRRARGAPRGTGAALVRLHSRADRRRGQRRQGRASVRPAPSRAGRRAASCCRRAMAGRPPSTS